MSAIWAKLEMLAHDASTLRAQVQDSVLFEVPYHPRDINKLRDVIDHLEGSLERAKNIK